MSLIPRRDYIASVMEKQGNGRNPRKYIVLRQWDTIVDHDRTYEVKALPLPDKLEPGTELYAITKPDSPDLSRVTVVEDRGDDGVFVEPIGRAHKVQFLVSRDELKTLPIPLRPHAIPRADLKYYIGDDAAKAWHDQRKARRHQPAPEHSAGPDEAGAAPDPAPAD